MAVPASAKRYAQAVFQIALAENQLERWAEELQGIVDAFEEPPFALVMESPRITLSDKARIVRQRLSSLHPTALNLAVLLISKGRRELAPNLVDEYLRLWDEHRGIAHARVITAVTLTQEEEESVARRLSEATGKQIQLETSVDPTIIAGIVVRLGDKIIDGSTRGQLQALKRSLGKA